MIDFDIYLDDTIENKKEPEKIVEEQSDEEIESLMIRKKTSQELINEIEFPKFEKISRPDAKKSKSSSSI
jgi:hypothetical protein